MWTNGISDDPISIRDPLPTASHRVELYIMKSFNAPKRGVFGRELTLPSLKLNVFHQKIMRNKNDWNTFIETDHRQVAHFTPLSPLTCACLVGTRSRDIKPICITQNHPFPSMVERQGWRCCCCCNRYREKVPKDSHQREYDIIRNRRETKKTRDKTSSANSL